MIRAWKLATVLMALACAMPFLFGTGQVSVVMFLLVLLAGIVSAAAGGSFWFPMLHDLVPVHRRGRFLGKLRAIWCSVSLVVILLGGLFLGKNPPVWRFQVVFFVALGLYTVRIYFVRKIPAGNSLAGELDYDHWKHYVLGLLREKPLLLFLVYYGALGFCMGFLFQPLVLYMKYRGFPANNNVIVYSFNMLGMILSFLFAGFLVDRFGTKRIFLSAHLILCAVCFAIVGIGMLSKAQAQYLLPIAMMVSGGTMSASGVACTAQLFYLIPDRGRAFYFSLSMIITGAGVAFSPLLVGWVLDIVHESWAVTILGCQFNIFQAILAAAGVLMLLIVSLLCLVQNVHPNRNHNDGNPVRGAMK